MSAEDAALLKDLRDEFLQSARVDLDDWESNLLDFETGDPEKMKDLRRLIHSMKGSSAAIGLIDLGDLMHELENWLSEKESKGTAPREIVSVGLTFVDTLRVYCSKMTDSKDAAAEVQSLRKMLI